MKEISESEMLHKMASYCSVAERCLQDVSKKLEASGLPEEAKKRVILRIIQEKFVDEKRFTRAFANDKLKFNQWGRIKIVSELRKKGISAPDINDAMLEINEGEYNDILQAVLKSKNRTIKATNERERFYKVLRFAVGRGFTPQEGVSCLKKILSSTKTDFDYDEDMA